MPRAVWKKSVVPIESKFKSVLYVVYCTKNLANNAFVIHFQSSLVLYLPYLHCFLEEFFFKNHQNCPGHFEPPSPRLPNCWNSHLGHTQLGNLVTYYGYDVRLLVCAETKNLERIPKLVVLGFVIFFSCMNLGVLNVSIS